MSIFSISTHQKTQSIQHRKNRFQSSRIQTNVIPEYQLNDKKKRNVDSSITLNYF